MTTRSRKRGEIRKGLVKFDRYKRARTERALFPRITGGVAALSLLLLERGKNFKESSRWDTHRLDDITLLETYQLSVTHRITKLFIVLPNNNLRNFVDHQITDNDSVTFR